ncbi:PPC domain-containing DNA-binding protein [Paraburkholderia tagetis]|uniref:DNA-binding protein n=1 Tax=Paraburkholderia tagetis TaxID=2913261 RepID=A0A9X1RM54_9BURK|nr:PPC domain-containing DNA-binding protein [Paraburkholderia tagetis]MCG5072077.1 DNA-binding protein [Paraburkholderia tagetis]
MDKTYLRRHFFKNIAWLSAGAVATSIVPNNASAQPSSPAECEAGAIAAAGTDVQRRYIKTPTGYFMVLRMGDNVFEQLTKFANAENIPAASVSAIGFGHATFGYWHASKKAFDAKTFHNVEMGSIVGSVAWHEGKPSIHLHGVAGDSNFNAYGGHLLDLEVGTGSMEITLNVHQKRLERAIDACIGANVLGI